MSSAAVVASVVGAWTLVVVSGDSAVRSAVLWGLASGAGAAIGSSALYRGYGRGQMAVAGPLSAVGAAALPALAGALLGERLPTVAVLGVLVALPAIWLVSGAGETDNGMRGGAVDGLVSGAGFALEFVGLERAGTDADHRPLNTVARRRPSNGLS